MSDRSRRRLRTTLTILVTALLVAPAAALATHGFNDVDEGDFYHAAVDWMKDNGVTVGCNPSGGNTKYCPDDPVTRGEMAVFLQRLDTQNVFLRPGEGSGGDGGDGGDADTLDGKDSTAFATATELAGLDKFIPIATFTVFEGDIDSVDFRDPITAAPTSSGSNGQFTIDFPGFSFSKFEGDRAVCTGMFRPYYAVVDSIAGGDLFVRLYESDGSLADDSQFEDDFICAVYRGS